MLRRGLRSQKWYQSLGNPPASASQVLRLQVANTTWFPLFGDIGNLIKGVAHARDVITEPPRDILWKPWFLRKGLSVYHRLA